MTNGFCTYQTLTANSKYKFHHFAFVIIVAKNESDHIKTPKVLIQWLGKRDADRVVAKLERIYAQKKAS